MKIVKGEESITIYANDVMLARETHDSVGWAGLEAVEGLAKKLAKELNLRVVEEHRAWGEDDE